MSTLPLNEIVQVQVNLSPISVARRTFGLGLILGNSTHITTADRVKLFSSLTEMTAAGFLTTDKEYLAAQIYFQQLPKPKNVVIGRWDTTGAETIAQALTACRNKNNEWYACFICDVTKANILASAAVIETMEPSSCLFFTTKDADVPLGTAGNVFLTLKGLSYKRTIGQYSTKSDYAAVAIMGYALGANTGLSGSSYALAYKKEIGVETEPLTSLQLKAILDANGNIYVNQGSYYDVFRQGKMSNGSHFDELVGLDTLVNSVQGEIMGLLTSALKIPQTDDGVVSIANTITNACEDALSTGFIAPGVWKGPSILTLSTGDTLARGYIILAESITSQSQADRDARISPPIYVCLKLAGAIEFAVVSITINR
jgi:hypothetical protein